MEELGKLYLISKVGGIKKYLKLEQSEQKTKKS